MAGPGSPPKPFRRSPLPGPTPCAREVSVGHTSTRPHARLVPEWGALIDLKPKTYGAPSLRRPRVAVLYRKTSNLRAYQPLPTPRQVESTVRHLAIKVDAALATSAQVDLCCRRPRPPRSQAFSESGRHKPLL